MFPESDQRWGRVRWCQGGWALEIARTRNPGWMFRQSRWCCRRVFDIWVFVPRLRRRFLLHLLQNYCKGLRWRDEYEYLNKKFTAVYQFIPVRHAASLVCFTWSRFDGKLDGKCLSSVDWTLGENIDPNRFWNEIILEGVNFMTFYWTLSNTRSVDTKIQRKKFHCSLLSILCHCPTKHKSVFQLHSLKICTFFIQKL